MNDRVFNKRITADSMRLSYRSELARVSGENVIYKTLLAYSDIITEFMLDGRTFDYKPEQVIEYVSIISGGVLDQMNQIRGKSNEDYLLELLKGINNKIPDDIQDQFDDMPDEPIYYDEEDEDEE